MNGSLSTMGGNEVQSVDSSTFYSSSNNSARGFAC